MVAACQTEAVSPSAQPLAGPSHSVPSTPAPPLAQVISHNLSQGIAPGEWTVIGRIENQGQKPLGQVRLVVSLLSAADEVITEASVGTLMTNLLPGEASPFAVSFEIAESPAAARVEVVGEDLEQGELADGLRPELVSELDEFFVTGSGELAVMGFVTNPGNRHVVFEALGFLGRTSNGIEKSLAVMEFGPNQLAPGETAPFLALAPGNPGSVRWSQYHDGLFEEPHGSDSLIILGEPQLSFTAQGAPFVVGAIANSGNDPAEGSVMVSLFEGNRLMGLWEAEVPRPLEAGEQLAFAAFGFPGVSLRFDPLDSERIRVETRAESSAAIPTRPLIDLPVDVSTFLSVGSAIFIRGTVSNPTDSGVEAATVYAEVRASTGELVTAGWSSAEALGPGASAEFVLDLPIPVGMDATLTEYDLRAIGLKAQP